APIYDSDGSAEVHNYENCYDNEILNMFTQEEQYTELLEPIPEPQQVPQNNNVISEVTSVEQGGETVEQHPVNFKETRSVDGVTTSLQLSQNSRPPMLDHQDRYTMKAQALKHVNFDLKTTSDHRKLQLNELNELRDQAYENSLIYKEKTKKLHDSKIKNRIFNVGDRVLLFNSHLKIFSRKLKTHWSGPFTITNVFPYGTIELSQPDGLNFKVNGHRVKHYFGGDVPQLVVPDLQTSPWTNKCGDRVKLCDSVTKNKALHGRHPMLILLSSFLFLL
nr:reverse transcriptase domain-containing protein [Tanacetum cinerariifolium]